jgi:hypothetical protein
MNDGDGERGTDRGTYENIFEIREERRERMKMR